MKTWNPNHWITREFSRNRNFKLWWSSILSTYFFTDHAFRVLSKEFLPNPRPWRFFYLVFPLQVLYFGFTSMFMAHSELVFILGVSTDRGSFSRSAFSNMFWTHLSPILHRRQNQLCMFCEITCRLCSAALASPPTFIQRPQCFRPPWLCTASESHTVGSRF